jgi:hypothetical protein
VWSDLASNAPETFSLARLILKLKRRALLRSALPAILQPRGGNVGIAQPLLHLGNVCVMHQRIRGGRGTQRVHAEAMDIGIDTDHGTVMLHNPLVDRIRM